MINLINRTGLLYLGATVPFGEYVHKGLSKGKFPFPCVRFYRKQQSLSLHEMPFVIFYSGKAYM